MTKRSKKQQKLGIIQTRGLGDIVIALPIALYYKNQGWDVYWPILEEFCPSMTNTVPWIHWIPIPPDPQGLFFYDEPMKRLHNLGIESAICLYQSLTGHPEFTARPEFQITGFDQIKYHIAQVPFLEKWNLAQCITRNKQRELKLFDQIVKDPNTPYVLIHKQGSSFTADVDPSWIPDDLKQIEITNHSDSVWDWLTTIERAQAIITVDSVFSNIMDQLKIPDQIDSYFIPRSHIHLTPVLGSNWTVLDPHPDTLKRISVFKGS